jgi:hypothetical protein
MEFNSTVFVSGSFIEEFFVMSMQYLLYFHPSLRSPTYAT